MVTLEVGDRYTKVSGASIVEKEAVKSLTSAKPAGYQYSTAFRLRTWDGNISLYRYNKFPSGLLDRVEYGLKEKGINYTAIRKDLPEVAAAEIHSAELRDYQKEAVTAVLSHGCGVLKMATNSGKTLVAASVILSTGCSAVVVVPSRALLLQTADKLEEYMETRVGRYGAGFKDIDNNVTVVTIASLDNFVQCTDLSDNRTVIIDECHHTRSKSIFDTIFGIPGMYRVGMSGTPLHYDELDDLKLIGATGDIIYEIKNIEMIDSGYSTKPIIIFTPVESPKSEDDYHTAYRRCIVGNALRNIMIADISKEEYNRGPILVVANWIEHAKCIYQACDRIGLTHLTMLTGKDSTETIERVLTNFGAGVSSENNVQVLVATDIFSEGVDIPEISTVVLAGGGVSHISLLQRIGRGLRVHSSKNELHVYDFIDDTNGYLLAHSMERCNVYEEEGFETRLRCGAVPF